MQGEKKLAAENPPTYMGVMVGGGASDAPSQLTYNTIKSKEARNEKGL